MDVDDEDPAWLEACMAAVDSMPVANLRSTSSEISAAEFSKMGRGGNEPGGSLGSGRPSNHETSVDSSSSRSSKGMSLPSFSLPGISRTAGSRWSPTATTAPAIGAAVAAGAARSSGQFGYGSYGRSGGSSSNINSSSRERPRASSSWPNESRRRMRGVGADPDDDVRYEQERGASEDLDPCWRCGEAVRFMDFGNNRFFGCSSHPLCTAIRKTRKNGAVVELIAEEKRLAAVHATPDSPAGSALPVLDKADPTGTTRCHLCVKVRGGHRGGAAQAAWEMLRRNNIIPTQEHRNLGCGGGGGGSYGGGGSSLTGNHAGGTSAGTRGMAGTQELKAVLELGMRDSVRRLLKQEGMSYRDIPQTTYSRLIASGAGDKRPTPSQARRKKGIDKSDPGHLQPLDACEALLYKLTVGLRDTLLPFQRDGVLYGLRRKGRCLIADEMGTGKTLQALGVMGCYLDDWPLLIIAPASMRLMWAEEVEHWYPFLAPSDIHLIKGNRDKLYLTGMNRHLWPRVVIVSYFMLRILADSIGKRDWKAVIFDESHMISTKLGDEVAQAQQVTVCVDLARKSERVVMLSGTPSLSKPFDLFNQVEAISPGLLGRAKDTLSRKKSGFAANYCASAMRGQTSKSGRDIRVPFIGGSEYPDELHLLLKNEVMIRRLKNNVVKQLPPLRRTVVRVVAHQEDLRRALKSGGFEPDVEAHAEGGEGGGGARGGPRDGVGTSGAGGAAAAGMMSDDQRTGLKKVKSASEWVVDKLLASQETLTKFVVFAHHKTVLDRLQEAFEEAGMRRTTPFTNANPGEASLKEFTCLRIDGSVPTAMRASRLSEFNTNERCRVLVVSITAGGQGLDFTAASNVVFVELPESPAWLRQAEDRLHRRRQEKSVNVYLTVLPAGSHDDTRWLSLNEKLTTQTSVMNGTLDAENMDVDRVCDAGGTVDDNDDSGPSPSSRGQCGKVNSKPRQRRDPASPDASDDEHAFCYDVNSDVDDDASSIEPSGCEGGGVSGDDARDDDGVAEVDLDEELRMALMSTPMDVPTHRSSQSPTLQLLRQIAESPASRTPAKPNIFSQAAGIAARKKKCKLEERQQGHQERRERTIKAPNTGMEKATDTGSKGVTTTRDMPMRVASASSAGSDQDVFASPAVCRKRPRSSPRSGDASTDSGNPFKTYGHYSRPPPPSPSSRLGVDVGSPTPASGVHLSQGAGEDVASMIASTPATNRSTARGTPETPSQGGDGNVASPVLLVDLSQEDEGSGEGAGKPENVSRLTEELHGSQSRPEALAGAAAREDDDAPSITWSADCRSSGDNVFDLEHGKSVTEGGQQMDREAEEQLLASKLFFLVSSNTGRVHVYKKEEEREEGGGSGLSDDGFDDEEETKPQHARCNFRPEDLDRLFEAAKEAFGRTESTPTPRPASSCESVAREVLLTLPKLLRSAPALTVARKFVLEWRALSSRKRPLLKGLPCRPPLQEQLAKVTPALKGSTRRYAEKAGTKSNTSAGGQHDKQGAGSTDDRSVTGIQRDASNKVMCLSCGEEAASEQGPAVHRRDRFCSVDCMEAHGSRTSHTSLRRLVLERDHGVCSGEGCGRDCLALLSRLTAVQNLERRRDILVGADPRFGTERHTTLMERLVRHPKGGNAWNADHVTAVYQGGGECGIDNLRTLCVVCHAEVTRVQTTERAATRRKDKERKRRSLEEAQGQRRIVSFGGGITLSAGLSQGSNAGHGGGSQGDVCEISSDGTDGNDDDDGCCSDNNNNDDDDGDDNDDAFVSPVEKAARTDRVRQRGSSSSSAAEEDAAPGGGTAVKPCPGGRESDHPTRRGCQEPRRANTPQVTSGAGKADKRRPSDKKRSSTLSSRAVFDRIVNGGGFGSSSTSGAGKGPCSPDRGQGDDAKKGSSSGKKVAAGDGSGDDDCCEIMFTRVHRPM